MDYRDFFESRNLKHYLEEIAKFPPLSEEEERKLGERVRQGRSLLHALQHHVARAREHRVQLQDSALRQRPIQRVDQRPAGSDGVMVRETNPVVIGHAVERFAVVAEHDLVRGDDMPAEGQRLLHQVPRPGTPREIHQDVQVGPRHERVRIAGHHRPREGGIERFDDPVARRVREDEGAEEIFFASIASEISSSVLPTPANTIFPGSTPAARARRISPPETTSMPDPISAIVRRMLTFELDFIE